MSCSGCGSNKDVSRKPSNTTRDTSSLGTITPAVSISPSKRTVKTGDTGPRHTVMNTRYVPK